VTQSSTPPPTSKAPDAQPATSERTWTVLELLQWTTDYLKRNGVEGARLDAEVLLAHALSMSRLDLYLNYENPVSAVDRTTFRELVQKRAQQRIPVSLLLGEREFWSMKLTVTSDVLTPRPETELLVSTALDAMPDPDYAYRVLDLGTGSGAIALAIASERPNAIVTATDVSIFALKVARLNADKLQLCDRVRFLEGSLFAAVSGEVFDLVISNPPYVARAEQDALPRELSHEPELALFGGEDGYAVLKPLVSEVGAALNDGGLFLVELDPRQAETVASWCREAEMTSVKVLHDLSGHARVVSARHGSAGEGQKEKTDG